MLGGFPYCIPKHEIKNQEVELELDNKDKIDVPLHS